MTTTTSSERRRAALEAAAWALGVAVVGAAFLVRLEGHAAYLHDHESLLVPTAGRELLHGHIQQLRWFQGNVYQGSSVVDALLSALGFAVFGDHLLAWKWYGLAYAMGIAAAGVVLLRRLTGPVGAVAFLLLLAASPFVIKDGLLTPAGGHSSGFLYGLVPLAIAVSGRGPPTWRRGLAAGAALAFGAWYIRTAVAAGPALLVALAPGGLRALAGCAVGLLGFPLLGAANALFLTADGGPLANRGFGLVFREVMGAIRAESATPAYAEKTLEALGVTLRPYLFAIAGDAGDRHHLELFAWAGRTWSAAWLVGIGLLAAALGSLAKAPTRAAGWAAAVLLALGAGYAASYVVAPFRVDPTILQTLADPVVVGAPGVPAPRYVVPIQLAWTLGLAGAAGLLWRWRWTRAASFGVLWVVGAGAWAAALDAEHYAEPDQLRDELDPFSYLGFYGPGLGRGPGMYWHVRCGHPDPISRAAHRRAAGRYWAADATKLVADPAYLSRRLDEFEEHWGRPLPKDVPFLVQGMGRVLGDAPHSHAEIPVEELVAGVFANAESLGPERGEVLLRGFQEGLPFDAVQGRGTTFVRAACAATSWGTRPLCPLIGRLHVDTELARVTTPEALFGRGGHPLFTSAEFGPNIVYGAASRLRRIAPTTQWSPESLAGWEPALADGFARGWAFADARASWRAGDSVDPFVVP